MEVNSCLRRMPMRMNKKVMFALIVLLISSYGVSGTDHIAGAGDYTNILPLRDQHRVINEILEWRLDNIIPMVMRREGIDMWIVICREYNEDPVYLSMIPSPGMSARRQSILVFHDPGKGQKVGRYTGSFYGMGKWYKSFYPDQKADQMDALVQFVREKNPKKIGLNFSREWAFGDGLSASYMDLLKKSLGEELSSRIVSAEYLCVGWLETRSSRELSIYRHICGVAHDLIAEAFSNRVIVPGITSTDDVKWWFRQKFSDLGLGVWFHPSVSIQRSDADMKSYPEKDKIIRRGDLLHCDIGIIYMRLCTDTQQNAYVCRIGESGPPEGLKKALKAGNRLQDILFSQMKEGRTGNEILKSSLDTAKAEGLIPSIYTHPLGIHGHAAGPTIGLWNDQDGIPVEGDYPLYQNTCYAIELNVKYDIPEWDGKRIRMGLEEPGVFTASGPAYIDGRQTELFIIR